MRHISHIIFPLGVILLFLLDATAKCYLGGAECFLCASPGLAA